MINVLICSDLFRIHVRYNNSINNDIRNEKKEYSAYSS